MKNMIAVLVILSQVPAVAATLTCGGRNSEGQLLQVVVDEARGSIVLSREAIDGGMPPYPFVPVAKYVIATNNSNATQVNVEGLVRQATTGLAARISVVGTRAKNTQRPVYNVTTTIQPGSSRVRPVPAVEIPMSCEVTR
jgi:hypothetical protein